VLAEVEDGHDVRVLEAAGGSYFSRKALASGRIVEAFLEQLDDHPTLDRRVTRQVDRAHAAVSDETLDVIAPDGHACRRHTRIGRCGNRTSNGRRSHAENMALRLRPFHLTQSRTRVLPFGSNRTA
jgi:hypothetical protein